VRAPPARIRRARNDNKGLGAIFCNFREMVSYAECVLSIHCWILPVFQRPGGCAEKVAGGRFVCRRRDKGRPFPGANRGFSIACGAISGRTKGGAGSRAGFITGARQRDDAFDRLKARPGHRGQRRGQSPAEAAERLGEEFRVRQGFDGIGHPIFSTAA
jgi:hypothetical protein